MLLLCAKFLKRMLYLIKCCGFQVVDFCQKYHSLTSMGFTPGLSVGALLAHNQNVQAASETLLVISNQ